MGKRADAGEPTARRPAASTAEPIVRAGGGIVVRAATRGGWEVAVVHRPTHADWTLPKGKLEDGETIEECALREVHEETGFRCDLGRYVGEVEYRDARGRPKVVSYWMMQPVEGGFVANEEIDDMEWLDLESAVRRLSYEHDSDLLRPVAAALASARDH